MGVIVRHEPAIPSRTAKSAGVRDASHTVQVIGINGAAPTVSCTTSVRSAMPVPVARTVMGVVPASAFAPTTIVNVLDVVPAANDAGVKLPVTSAGSPSKATFTAPENPPSRSSVSTTVVVLPAVAETAADGADRLMDGTVSVSGSATVLAATPVPVARIVIEVTPATAPGETVSVRVVDVDAAASVAVPKAAVTPEGRLSAVSVTAPVKPPPRTIETVVVAGDSVDADSAVDAADSTTVGVGGGGVTPPDSPPPPHDPNSTSNATRAQTAPRARWIIRLYDLKEQKAIFPCEPCGQPTTSAGATPSRKRVSPK